MRELARWSEDRVHWFRPKRVRVCSKAPIVPQTSERTGVWWVLQEECLGGGEVDLARVVAVIHEGEASVHRTIRLRQPVLVDRLWRQTRNPDFFFGCLRFIWDLADFPVSAARFRSKLELAAPIMAMRS